MLVFYLMEMNLPRVAENTRLSITAQVVLSMTEIYIRRVEEYHMQGHDDVRIVVELVPLRSGISSYPFAIGHSRATVFRAFLYIPVSGMIKKL